MYSIFFNNYYKIIKIKYITIKRNNRKISKLRLLRKIKNIKTKR